MAIQHRGQDAAGIGTVSKGRFRLYKDLGMVPQALPPNIINTMPGTIGIGHVRYPTLGGSEREDAQPFLTRRPGILMAHNGNITNIPEVSAALMERGIHILSSCDSEPILMVLADELTKIRVSEHTVDDVHTALTQLMTRLRGSYSVAAVLQIDGRETLLAFRDPQGIRPAVYGRRGDGAWAVTSESVALDGLGFERAGFLPPGGMMLLRAGEEPVVREVLAKPRRHCVFEQIYFARADSVMEAGRVNTRRWEMGKRLAREWQRKGLKADVVVAIPDTSRPAAMAMAETLGIPNREGFIKNRYSDRTFIMPDKSTREAALRLKLNPIEEIFEGKRVLLVDDSIVRGSTMRRIVKMVRTLKPKEVHIAIFSPPVRHPCFYGIDMPSHEELVASAHDIDQVEERLAEEFFADSLTYLSQEGLHQLEGEAVCSACFTGNYPQPVSEDEREYILSGRSAR
jgi:amidophosphoribosyltransferase